jgi:ATP-binding cassette, subfamily F, member 3
MGLVTVIGLSQHFAGRDIFENVGFGIESGDRIGLIGPNGSGKTTLLRLLAGEISPEGGEIRVSKGARVGYLPQDLPDIFVGPLLPAVLNGVPGRAELVAECERVEAELNMVSGVELQAAMAQRIAELHLEMSRLELQFPRHEAEKILEGLGFKTEDFERPVSTLSGGWKMRAALAALLYQKPDLLLLDEPTNHLDIPSVRWLTQFLGGFKSAMVLVCHDREFMNRQVRRIISFEEEAVRCYTGDYDSYLKMREQETEGLEAAARNQEQKVKAAQKFIERFQYKASKARQAQSKIKLLKKMELIETYRRPKRIHFSFPDFPESGRVVLTIADLGKGFGSKTLYRDLNLSILRGERVAVIGANGCGKTTLLKMVAGEMVPDQGKITVGHGTKMAYFAQHHSEMLNAENTVLQEVYREVPHERLAFVRNVCGAFLFSGEDVDKPVGVLSGGERARVSLAKILVNPGNFMVMDEPTNHLDLFSAEILIDALSRYKGTLMFVSHNQSFVNRLATKILDVRDGRVIEYPGTLDEYYEHLERIEAAKVDVASEKAGKKGSMQGVEIDDRDGIRSENTRDGRKLGKKEKAERRRLVQEALNPILVRLEQTEQRISEIEGKQRELEGVLSDTEFYRDERKSVPLLNEYNELRKELNELMELWEQSQMELQSARAALGV